MKTENASNFKSFRLHTERNANGKTLNSKTLMALNKKLNFIENSISITSVNARTLLLFDSCKCLRNIRFDFRHRLANSLIKCTVKLPLELRATDFFSLLRIVL